MLVVKTRIFANSLKNMVPIVTNSQTGSLIGIEREIEENYPNEIVPNEKSRITSNFCDSLTAVLKTLKHTIFVSFRTIFHVSTCCLYEQCSL